MDIKDKAGNIQFTLTSPSLQLGYLCYCLGCLKFARVREYHIVNTNKYQVGKIINIYNDCPTSYFSRAGSYGIHFPKPCDLETKVNLIQTTIFLDYLQYSG